MNNKLFYDKKIWSLNVGVIWLIYPLNLLKTNKNILLNLLTT